MQVRDSANGGLMVPVTPALAQSTVQDNRPQGDALPAANAQVPPNTAPPPGARPLPGPRVNEPAQGSTAQAPTNAPARQGNQAPTPRQATAAPNANASRPQQAAPASPNAPRQAQTNARQPQANPDGTPATQAPAEGRVMIGAQAVQASDDEAWYEGAAKAAQAAVTDNASNRPLEQVIIASSTVNGRVTRVGKDTLHVRDGEGTVYELQLDQRSRGLRQGQRVPLKELEEGTPVRAQFVLMGGRTVARDVQVRR
ncbi:hypothetical protein HMI50_16310 [Corallococcus carmarthensis]|uniref:Uncharacterized protein n=2 Tax=Corallococcus carmarthensis TaxID=2316728 RepID=A0A3A8JW82_9BACT|nr:hypothetical protein [Corallococcus carmarthensis]RKG99148.1 hypothetical protein D7X32_27410 [Corallococcus carmarthensis]